MKLLHQDPKATDLLYHNVQRNHIHFDPPTLFKDRVEGLYAECHALVDKNFAARIKHEFASRYSELYFCMTFKKRLGLNVAHPSDAGPDFYLQDLNCWAEVVTLSNGERDNLNSIPPIQYVVTDHPRNQIILRITSSFTDKAKKISEYIKRGIIQASQGIIICISGGWIEAVHRIPIYPVGSFPEAVNALLPIGDMALVMNSKDMRIARSTFAFRDTVPKHSKDKGTEAIKTDYFIDPAYAYISGVIYSYANVTDPIGLPNLGSDFFVIHNPLATNRLPVGSIKCGVEYKVEFDADTISSITTIEH